MTDSTEKTSGKKGDGTLKNPKIYEAFVKFYAAPDPEKAMMFEIPLDYKSGKFEKIPKEIDFARKYGISDRTLISWKKREDFQMRVDNEQKDWGLDKVSNVMAALYNRCVRYGFANEVELWLAYYKNWNRQQVVHHVHEKFDMDDIRALLAPLPKEKQDEYIRTLNKIASESELVVGNAEAKAD